jgi:electron transport complex protein RnfG
LEGDEMKETIKLGIFLLVVCAIVGLGVAYVNDLTKPTIDQRSAVDKIAAYKEIMPTADEIKDETKSYFPNTNGQIKQVNVAYKGGEKIGVIYLVESRGYSSTLSVLVGISLQEKTIQNVKVLSQGETPGLGAQCIEKWFTDRYKEKKIDSQLEVIKGSATKDNEVQAITASTITSKAVTAAVNQALTHFNNTF